MNGQIPLSYSEWNEDTGLSSIPLSKVLVSQGVLFLRKLVNATVIQNRIWEHSSHESDGEQAFIYVKPFNPSAQLMGEVMERAVFSRYDVSEQYEVEYWQSAASHYECLMKRSFSQSLEAAQILLDHYIHIKGIHFEVLYAILDPARKKVLLFLQRTAFNS